MNNLQPRGAGLPTCRSAGFQACSRTGPVGRHLATPSGPRDVRRPRGLSHNVGGRRREEPVPSLKNPSPHLVGYPQGFMGVPHTAPPNVSPLLLLLSALFPLALVLSAAEHHGELSTRDGRRLEGIIHLTHDAFHVTDTNGNATPIPIDNLLAFRLSPPPPPPAPPPPIHGLRATYFSEHDFKGSSKHQIDDRIDFDWGEREPFPPLGKDRFSIRWEGLVEAPASGTYLFHTTTDDGVRLWVNGNKLIDQWRDQSVTEARGEIQLQEGARVPIKLEYYEASGHAVVRLFWTPPGPAPTRVILPNEHLFPGERPPSEPGDDASRSDHGQGLLGLYFNNTGLQGDFITVTHRVIDFDWGDQGPVDGVNSDMFSVRWTGLITPKETASYEFHADANDGVRLWIDHKLVIDRWVEGIQVNSSEPIPLQGGQAYPIRLEMFEARGTAKMRLLWSTPEWDRTIVPGTVLQPDASPDESGAVPALTHGVVLRNGSLLARHVRDVEGEDLMLDGSAPPAPIPLFQVSRIYFRSMPANLDDPAESRRSGALLKSGDFIDGTFKGFEGGRIVLSSVVLGRRRIPKDQVVMVSIREPTASRAPFEVVLSDGSRLRVRNLRPDADRLHFSDNGLDGWSIPIQDLIAIRRSP